MPLVYLRDDPTYFPPIFEPGYITGELEVENPFTGAFYSAYGLTVMDAEQRSEDLARLWQREKPKGSGRSVSYQKVPE